MREFPRNYDSADAENKWYAIWEERGYFKPEVNPGGEPYSIVIPPPNVTGALHMGHALNATLQDALVRYYRMRGRRALWLPGTDHAGIATQNVVERTLDAEGRDRHSMGREEFIGRVWEWKREYGGRITHQLRRMGASCDWSRERFTMDEGLSRAVREVFVRLYEDGLIYRAKRLINWCPRCRTALSDLEVEHEDTKGTLTYIKYPLADGSGTLTVATTRPETMLGDTAVAVNPEDERYGALMGKHIRLPLTGREIPVVGDASVDREFGTGAVKITPGHDFNDEAVGKRQDPPLPSITVIGEDGRMTAEAGAAYEGMDRYACRKRVVEDLRALGLIEREDAHAHAVGHCYRCRTVIEPYATPQWYVKVKPLAEEAIRAVEDGRIRIVPEGWANNYYGWMRDIEDWCITRQIWWGHRVPVWYCRACGDVIVDREDPDYCRSCGSGDIERDPDVLDTWFSSALWPFSTMGWPDKTEDLGAFYPTSVLVTAFDILFFWVARMIMMGLRFMGDAPFRDVYIHAIVRDAEGQKMSKSKGNVIDPLVMIEKFGADAFRFTLAAFAAQGRDVKFSEERVEGYRHFINKLWNATRFIMMNLGDREYPGRAGLEASVREAAAQGRSTLATRWILSRLTSTVEQVHAAMASYEFNEAAGAVYHFAWHEFCDWYIEMAKTEMTDDTRNCLLYALETVVRLLHPFMPFLTEEIWAGLPIERECESLCLARFPEAEDQIGQDAEAEEEMAFVMDAIGGIRNIRGELNVSPKERLEVLVKTEGAEALKAIEGNLGYITALANAEVLRTGEGFDRPEKAYTSVKDQIEVFVLPGAVDVEGETGRLERELEKTDESLGFIQKKLANPDFVGRAPEHVVGKERQRYDELLEKRRKLLERIESLRG